MRSAATRLEEAQSREARSREAPGFDTDANAPPGSHDWHMHQARLALEAYRTRGADGTGPKVQFKSALDLVRKPYPKLQWLVEGVIQEGALFVIGGAPKTSKTWALIQIAVAVAHACPAFGEFVVPQAGNVKLFLPEDSERSFRSRVRASAVGIDQDPEGEGMARIGYQCRGQVDVTQDRDLCAIIAAVRMDGQPIRMLGIDPMRDIHSGAENESDEMAPVMAALRALRDILKTTVVFVHHNSRDDGKTKKRPGLKLRGSTVIYGSIDGGLYMDLADHSPTHWVNRCLVESKEGEAAGEFALRLDVTDEDRQAANAKWTFTRGQDSAPDAEERRIELAVATVAREPGGWSSMNKISLEMGGNKGMNIKAINAAIARRRIFKDGDDLYKSAEVQRGLTRSDEVQTSGSGLAK